MGTAPAAGLGHGVGRSVTLSDGFVIPLLGLGTFRSRGDEARGAVAAALKCGYRHIDTASIYKNEEEVGEAVRASGLQRGDVWVTSKISPYEQGYDKAVAACRGTLSRLQMPYVDLMLVHWPGGAKLPLDSPRHAELRAGTWRALEDCRRQGLCRSIGVSNYTERHLEGLLASCEVRPAVNQVEVHPWLQQRALRAACEREGVHVQAYSPLGAGELLGDGEVGEVAARVGQPAARVLLRWALQEGCTVLPKSVREERIEANAGVFGFELGRAEMEELGGLESGKRVAWDPTGVL